MKKIKSDKMIVRKMTLKDRKNMIKLFEKLHQKKFKNISMGFKANPIILVAEYSGKLAGFIWGTYINYAAFHYGIIEDLFVEEAFRNKGIGKDIVKEMIKEFKKLGTHELFVTTEESNKSAIALYKASGFSNHKGTWLYMRLVK